MQKEDILRATIKGKQVMGSLLNSVRKYLDENVYEPELYNAILDIIKCFAFYLMKKNSRIILDVNNWQAIFEEEKLDKGGGFKSIVKNCEDDAQVNGYLFFLFRQFYYEEVKEKNPEIEKLNRDCKEVLDEFPSVFRSDNQLYTYKKTYELNTKIKKEKYIDFRFAKTKPKNDRLKEIFFNVVEIIEERGKSHYSDLFQELKNRMNMVERSYNPYNILDDKFALEQKPVFRADVSAADHNENSDIELNEGDIAYNNSDDDFGLEQKSDLMDDVRVNFDDENSDKELNDGDIAYNNSDDEDNSEFWILNPEKDTLDDEIIPKKLEKRKNAASMIDRNGLEELNREDYIDLIEKFIDELTEREKVILSIYVKATIKDSSLSALDIFNKYIARQLEIQKSTFYNVYNMIISKIKRFCEVEEIPQHEMIDNLKSIFEQIELEEDHDN